MLGRTIVGLDVGSHAIRAAEIRAGLRGVELVRLEEIALTPGLSPEDREATIRLFLEQQGVPREFVVTALPADLVTQRHLRFPFSGATRIEQAIRFEIEEDLPFSLSESVLTHEQVMSSPEQTDVLAVLTSRAELRRYLLAMARLEIDPRIVETEGSVLANLASLWSLSDVGRVLLDIGHSKTTLCLLVDGRPALQRSIPIGGLHLTEAIARDLQIDLAAAEEHKLDSGLFEPGSTEPTLATVATTLDRLAREIIRSLQAIVPDPLAAIAPAEIVLLGGSAQAPGLADYLERQTGLPCQLIGAPPPETGLLQVGSAQAPVFAQAIALALRGAPTTRVTTTNYRSDADFRYTPDLSGLDGPLRLTTALFGLVLVLWIASAVSQSFGAREAQNASERRLQDLYSQTFPDHAIPADPMAALDSRLLDARDLAQHLGVTGAGLSVLEVLRHISARVPPEIDVSLNELRVERHSVEARGHTSNFESVDRMREELHKVEYFEEVELSDVVNDPKRGGKRFRLRIKLRGGGA